jgi:hypothetical protein
MIANQPDLSRQRRRALDRKIRALPTTLPVMKDLDLTNLAFSKLTEQLISYGNVLTSAHREALYCVTGRFTHLANGYRVGRWGYDLPCGSGKTEAAKAWCWALWKLNKPYSVAISASKVEALCELKRGLIALGVPETAIGLIHSYEHKPEVVAECRARGEQLPNGVASLPCTDNNDTRQILLLTHNKLRSGSHQQDRLPHYQGQPRSLLIYDESLLISDTWTLSIMQLEQAKGYLEPLVKYRPDVSNALKDALSYSMTCLDILGAELEAQKEREPQLVQLPALDPAEQERLIGALKDDQVRALRKLIAFSQSPMRAVATHSGGGYCWYELAIPHDLQAVAVLDASLVIRHLPKIGGRLETDPAFNGNIKGNSNVIVHQMRWRSGRQSIEAAFDANREQRLVSKEVIEVVKTIPENEGVIIWSFKERSFTRQGKRSINVLSLLKEDMNAAGINTESTINTRDGLKPRLVFLTWGNETSTNDYAYCANVIMAGVLHRDDIDLAANVLGQKDNLLANYGNLHEIKQSEIAHVVYQAMSRGSCRVIVNGEAAPMKAWLIHHDDTLEDTIRIAMPHVQWREWAPLFIKGVAQSETRKVAKTVINYLANLGPHVTSVSAKALKAALGVKCSDDVWKSAVHYVADNGEGWRREGRSFHRVTAADFGFNATEAA